jgi:2-succinyl-5-enolpyruvyl-6-hydroxy-3-cyclohexene-1-carboxylate synthase
VSVPTDKATQPTFAATLVDEWIRCGVTDTVICPGSRSAPLALALSARPEIRVHVRIDERGAGFFAIGLALATGRPAVVCTTSGTAAAELLPAVVEAHHARVPLIVCTADRPPELHDVGAPQTIEQTRLYGPAVRWAWDPGPPDAAAVDTWRPFAARAVAEATKAPVGPGPVHLNLAFREPLVAEPGPLPAGRPRNRPVLRVHGGSPPPDEAETTVVFSWPGRRGVIVVGEGCGSPATVLALAERLGWPVLADPRSGCRTTHPNAVAAADGFLRAEQVRAALAPQVVLTLGQPWASKVVGAYLAAASADGAEIVAVDPWWRWNDPDHIVEEVHRADPSAWLEASYQRLLATPSVLAAPARWLEGWQATEQAAQRAIETTIAEDQSDRGGVLTEPSIARHLLRAVPPTTRVVASSSMPIRDLEWFAPRLDPPPRVLANRGANGIDGVCSTALGAAAAGVAPVVGLVGDLAFFHDTSALVRLSPASAPMSCTLVVVDNGGGGIFSFLPPASAVDAGRFELLFGTPPVTSVSRVAAGFGIPTADVSTIGEFDASLNLSVGQQSLSVIRAVVPDRADNVKLHDRINEEVARGARMALGV